MGAYTLPPELERQLAALAAQIATLERMLALSAEIYAEVATEETTTSTSYADLATVGPAITLPAAGVYVVEVGAGFMGSAIGLGLSMSYAVGAVAADDAVRLYAETQVASQRLPNGMRASKLVATGPTTLTAKYKVTSGTGTIRTRTIRAARISG